MHLVNPPPSPPAPKKKCITIIFYFACRLILGDLGADSGGKGKSCRLSTQEKGEPMIMQNLKGGVGGGGRGKQGALIMAMLKWYFFRKMLAYRFCIDGRKRRSYI